MPAFRGQSWGGGRLGPGVLQRGWRDGEGRRGVAAMLSLDEIPAAPQPWALRGKRKGPAPPRG